MVSMLHDALEAGAAGISSSAAPTHLDIHGQPHRTRGALEQLGPQPCLQPLDRFADIGLAGRHLFSSTRETRVLGDSHEYRDILDGRSGSIH